MLPAGGDFDPATDESDTGLSRALPGWIYVILAGTGCGKA